MAPLGGALDDSRSAITPSPVSSPGHVTRHVQVRRNRCSSAFGTSVQVVSERLFKCFRNTQRNRRDSQRSLVVSAKEHRYASSELHASLYRAAIESQARADFERAVASYESYAEATHYSGREAALALYRAARLRQLLEPASCATDATQRFVAGFAPTHPRLAAELLLSAARCGAHERNWTATAALLTPKALGWLERSELLDALFEARSLLASAKFAVHDAASGRELLLANYRLAETPGRLFLSVAASGGNLADLKRGLDASGEARFFVAEQVGERVRARRIVPFQGERTKDRLHEYVSSHVDDWYARHQRELVGLDPLYERVLQIKYEAPPRWVVAAAQRVGHGWAMFVEDVRSVPTLPMWDHDYTLVHGTPH